MEDPATAPHPRLSWADASPKDRIIEAVLNDWKKEICHSHNRQQGEIGETFGLQRSGGKLGKSWKTVPVVLLDFHNKKESKEGRKLELMSRYL